jgi:hypothetical protein
VGGWVGTREGQAPRHSHLCAALPCCADTITGSHVTLHSCLLLSPAGPAPCGAIQGE